MQRLRELCFNTHAVAVKHTEHKAWNIHEKAMAINGWTLDFSSNRTLVFQVMDIHLFTFISFFLRLVWQP